MSVSRSGTPELNDEMGRSPIIIVSDRMAVEGMEVHFSSRNQRDVSGTSQTSKNPRRCLSQFKFPEHQHSFIVVVWITHIILQKLSFSRPRNRQIPHDQTNLQFATSGVVPSLLSHACHVRTRRCRAGFEYLQPYTVFDIHPSRRRKGTDPVQSMNTQWTCLVTHLTYLCVSKI